MVTGDVPFRVWYGMPYRTHDPPARRFAVTPHE